MDQITPTGFASLVFGALAQVSGLTLRTVASDAASVTLANGQQFTVTVTASASRPKPAEAKREKGGKA